MEKNEQYFYKYTVQYCDELNDYKWRTVRGLTFGRTFNEACAKITDYFGEDVIEELKIVCVSDCDMMDEDDLMKLFEEDNDEKMIEKDEKL